MTAKPKKQEAPAIVATPAIVAKEANHCPSCGSLLPPGPRKRVIFNPDSTDFTSEAYFRAVLTPAIGKDIIAKRNAHNRIPNSGFVELTVVEITSGSFKFNAQTISFFKDGNLADGQNRIMACIEAGMEIEVLIATGLELDVQNTIDTGRNRKLSTLFDFTYGKDIANPTKATIAKVICAFDNPADGEAEGAILKNLAIYTKEQQRQYVIANHDEITNAAAYVMQRSASERMLTPKYDGLMYILLHRIDPNKADHFLEKLNNGIEIPGDSPILYLRNRLIESRARANKVFHLTDREIVGMVFKTWNLFYASLPGKKLQFSKNERLPALAGLTLRDPLFYPPKRTGTTQRNIRKMVGMEVRTGSAGIAGTGVSRNGVSGPADSMAS